MKTAELPLWERLTFSGLVRYVMICECVFNSDAFLSQSDRAQVIQNLLARPEMPTPESIEAYCQVYADNQLEANMVSARLNIEYQRG